jgi:hypothetical protein
MMKTKKFALALIPAITLALMACGGTPATNNAQAATKENNSSSSVINKPVNTQVDKNVPADVAKAITQTLQTNYASQNLQVLSITTTPITGLYEVVVSGKQITYTDATGQFMLVGDLIATKEGRSLTEERKAILNQVDFNALPFDKAIKEVRGNGALKVAVFSDPDCPYCKRLERELAKMTNVTIYNFMMPIPSLHADAARKAVQIWCQPNRTQVWNAWMREGKAIPKVAECANPVAETTALGESFGFNGTPTLVFPNGKTQSGYLPMPEMEIVIKQNQK